MLCLFNLILYQGEHLVLQAVRRHHQMFDVRDGFSHQQRTKDFIDIRANIAVCRQQRQIRVQPRGLFVIIARADLRNVLEAILLLAHNLAQLAMYLVFAKAINNMAACFLQSARHFDVVGFIKPRAQFHHNNHFSAVFRRFNQRINDFALVCHTVQRHANADHRLVLRRLMQHAQKRLHALIRIRQQHVFLANLIQHAFLHVQRRRITRTALFVKQLRPIAQIMLQLEYKGQIQRSIHSNDMLHVDAEMFGEFLAGFFVDVMAQLHAHRTQAGALLDELFHHAAVVQVLIIYLDAVNVCIARHAQNRLFLDGISREQLGRKL